MARKAKFVVYGDFDRAGSATVIIDRGSNVMSVRPKHRHKVYELPLHIVADIIMWKCIKAEVLEKKKAKLAKRKGF